MVDSLFLRVSVNRHPSPWLLSRLAAWRANREAWYDDPKGTETLLESIPALGSFSVMSSSRPYESALINPEICDIRIWNPDKWSSAIGSQTSQFFVVFRSRFLSVLWRGGCPRVPPESR